MTDLVPFSGSPQTAISMIDRADLAETSKRKYRAALARYLDTGAAVTDAQALADYAAGLGRSQRAHLKAAVSLWAKKMQQQIRAASTPQSVDVETAALRRLEAIQNAITVKKQEGQKAHTWLTRPEVTRLMDAARSRPGVIGRRDAILLGILLGAGLRRNEATQLTYDDILRQPSKGRDRYVLSIRGKRDKERVIPISVKLADMLEAWRGEAGSGRVLRSVAKGGEIGGNISAVGIFQIVRSYGRKIGHPGLAPHDLRRTYAQIGYESGVPVTQISRLLGHESIETTQKYLNLDLDLETTISDFIPL